MTASHSESQAKKNPVFVRIVGWVEAPRADTYYPNDDLP